MESLSTIYNFILTILFILTLLIFFIPLLIISFQLFFAMRESRKVEYIKEYKLDKSIYVREVPNKNNTAIGVAFLLYNLNSLTYKDIQNRLFRAIQATILELHLKGCIEINENENDKTIIKIVNNSVEGLTKTQCTILDFIKKFTNQNQEIEVNEFKKKIKENRNLYRYTFGSAFVAKAISEQEELGNCDKDLKEHNIIKKGFISGIILEAIITFIFILFFMFSSMNNNAVFIILKGLTLVILLYSTLLLIDITRKILQRRKVLNYNTKIGGYSRSKNIIFRIIENIIDPGEYETHCVETFMTNKGLTEREQWKAFRKYLKDYTLIKDYKRESILINKDYLIYATLFGIADEVQDDLGKYKPIILWNY